MTDQQTPEDEQDLTEDPIEAMLREPGTREGGLPPAPVVNKEWAEAKQKSARAALRPTELQIRLLHYGKLSGGLMSDELQRIKAENGEKETTDALEKLMNHGLLDRGHVITDKGKAALLGLNPE